jgi:hypothetical protein
MNPARFAAPLLVMLLLPLPASSEPSESRVRRFEGELTKVSEESISVKPVRRGQEKAGIEWTVSVDDKTKVVRSVPDDRKGRRGYRTEAASLADLAVGQHVRVKADAERAEEINIVLPQDKR